MANPSLASQTTFANKGKGYGRGLTCETKQALEVDMHHFDLRLVANCNFLIDKQWCMIIPQSEYCNTLCQLV